MSPRPFPSLQNYTPCSISSRVNISRFVQGLKKFLRLGHSMLKLGKVQANLGQLLTLNSSLLTAVGIQMGPASSGSKHLLSFLKFTTANALFTILLIVHHHLPCSSLTASIGFSCFGQYVYIMHSLRDLWFSRFY